jgi:hypothetical protein
MANRRTKSVAAPDGWADVFIRTFAVLVIAFVTLNLKEWFETNEWDIPACTVDAAVVAAGTLLFYGVMAIVSKGPRPTEERLPLPAAR